MKFLVDNQLPKALTGWLRQKGHDAEHVLDRGQGQTDDRLMWHEAGQESRIVVSKDEDFFLLGTEAGYCGCESETAGRRICSNRSIKLGPLLKPCCKPDSKSSN